MTIASHERFGDTLSHRFDVPLELQGRVLDTLEEVKELFPASDDGKVRWGEVYLNETLTSDGVGNGIQIYSRPLTLVGKGSDKEFNAEPRHVAYKCGGSCGKYVIGPPRAEHVDNIGFLAGRVGNDYYCTNCGDLIVQMTFISS